METRWNRTLCSEGDCRQPFSEKCVKALAGGKGHQVKSGRNVGTYLKAQRQEKAQNTRKTNVFKLR